MDGGGQVHGTKSVVWESKVRMGGGEKRKFSWGVPIHLGNKEA